MEIKEHCTIFVDLSHLSAFNRVNAAAWAIKRFGVDNVDVMRPLEKMGRYGNVMTPGFWFAKETHVTMFKLAWG